MKTPTVREGAEMILWIAGRLFAESWWVLLVLGMTAVYAHGTTGTQRDHHFLVASLLLTLYANLRVITLRIRVADLEAPAKYAREMRERLRKTEGQG